MPDLPSLDELEEEHWSIIVLAHRLAEAAAVSPPPSELPDLIERLCLRCDAHITRAERLIQERRAGPVDGLVTCQTSLRRLLSRLRPAEASADLAATMTAFETALIMTLQHDRAVLLALHGLPQPPIISAPVPDAILE